MVPVSRLLNHTRCGSSSRACIRFSRALSSGTPTAYDVAIVGGGVVGSSIAYHMKIADPSVSVCVVERDPTYSRASTPLSAGSIRQQFSIRGNVEMGLHGIDFLRQWDDHMKISPDDDCAPDIQLVEGGYLFLAGSDEGEATLRENQAMQLEMGADNVILNRDELTAKFPWLTADDLTAGCFGQTGEGWFDPWALLTGFKRKAISLGVDYVEASCSGVDVEGSVVRSVRTAEGHVLSCGTMVNAAGGWAHEVSQFAGIHNLPVRRRKRFIFVVHCPTGPVLDCPLVVDPTGVYFRREGAGGNFICGRSPAEDADPDADDLEVDHSFFETEIWPYMAHRCSAFNALKQSAAWAGFYDYNTLDQNAILGPHPEIVNFIFANGFSGHGLMQSPAVGKAISEQILTGSIKSFDFSELTFDRIVENRPAREKNVV